MIDPSVRFFFEKTIRLTGRTHLKQFIAKLFKIEQVKLQQLNYIFCSDEALLKINQQFLRHDFLTDVITFPLSAEGEPVEGEIYISIDRVRENAESLGISQQVELRRVIFHGALHLCGYRDKKKDEIAEIRQREDFYLAKYEKDQGGIGS